MSVTRAFNYLKATSLQAMTNEQSNSTELFDILGDDGRQPKLKLKIWRVVKFLGRAGDLTVF